MGRPIYDINNSLNWDLSLRESLTAIDAGGGLFMPSRSLVLSSPLVLVGCRSQSAKPNWVLGVRAIFSLMTSPSSTSEFMAQIEFHRQNCWLGRLNLIKVPPLYPRPYLLTIQFPSWHKDMLLEIWRYSGIDEDMTEELVRDVLVELADIGTKIDNLNQ